MSDNSQTENRLAGETSPYLLQHKSNPVDWYPWGDEAFARARAENRPILLSIGYAACHWCHVMAHESFEDSAIAALMNELYICIKVDREERPDVDALYMAALQSMGTPGGWPLTMFLTPEAKPFLGGTYFPPTPRYGAPAFPDVLRSVAKLYGEQRAKVEGNVAAIADALKSMASVPPKRHAGLYAPDQLDAVAEQGLGMMDMVHGGTFGAPKFPQPMLLNFLWRAGLRTKNQNFAQAVTISLTQMCQGGIYDHLAGGFARYSTDEMWLAPHFEKMLYDNAQLIELLGLLHARTHDALYERRLRESIQWCLTDLATDEGGFAGTLDADSEGEEGRFYVWTEDEIDAVLGADSQTFKKIYDVQPAGNWEGRTILNRTRHAGPLDAATETMLDEARAKLLSVRDTRIRPALDDKILADWNGMTIAALAQAALQYSEPTWQAASLAAYDFIATHMQSEIAGEKRLRHSYRDGVAGGRDVLDDYAQMIRASLMLYQTSGDQRFLADAQSWTHICNKHFWDADEGGYFLAPDDATDLVARTRNAFDTATPSGNGIMAENLARLYHLSGDETHRQRCESIVDIFARRPMEHYINMPGILNGFELLHAAVQVVVIGRADDEMRASLARVAMQAGLPNLVLMQIAPETGLPPGHAAQGKTMIGNHATAYICVGQTCGLPVTEAADLAARLAEM